MASDNSSFSFCVPSAAKAPLWRRAGLDMFRDPATEAQLQAALSGLMGVTGQLQEATVFLLFSTLSMLLAKLGNGQVRRHVAAQSFTRSVTILPSMHQALCRCWRRTCNVAATSFCQMFRHRNCRVIP